MSKKMKWILPIAAVLLIIAIWLIHFFHTKTRFNDTYVNGNTAGNLYNGGMFCEYDGTVYFANPDDNYRLYSMSLNGDDVKKLSNDTATFINADEHYIYYARNNKAENSDFSFLRWNNNSLCRINRKNGKGRVILDPEPSMYASLLGNYMYYLHYDKDTATTMYRVKIDGKEKEQVKDQPYYTCSANGNYLYYNGLENDRHIYSMNAETQSSNRIFDGDCWMPIVDGDTAYYMDCSNNYCLTKVNLNTKETTVLTNERVDCFNVYGSTIYYCRNQNPALCRMQTDGSNSEVISEGIYTDINITSQFVYFRRLNENDTVFYTPTTGAANINTFHAGVKD